MLDPVQRSALDLVALGRTQADVAAELGIRPRTLSHWVQKSALRGEIGGPPIPEIGRPPDGFVVARNNAEYDADGTLRRQWVATKRDAGDVFEMPAGHVVKGVSALLDADGREMARWVKTREGSSENFIDALKTVFAEYDGKSHISPCPSVSDDDILTEYPIPDLHIGQHSWGREAGENYNVKIAVETATKSLSDLVSQSRTSTEAVVLFMGDYTHSNDEKGVTPAHQHRLDNDGRWQKVSLAAAKLAVNLIDIVAAKHPKVTVRVLQGNHDPDASAALFVSLSLFYSNNDRITIEDDPANMWYRRFGRCLLAATHGHQMKPTDMAMALAVDRAEDWGQTTYRHIAYGHVHHAQSKEIMGVMVESFQAITARDVHATNHGYRSGRSVTALTWHREHGEIGRHRVNISGAAARKVAA